MHFLRRTCLLALCWTILASGAVASPSTSTAKNTADHGKANKVEPVARDLTSEERLALEEGLDLAARIAHAPRPLDIADVQRLYDGYLDEGITDSDAIIALGLAFGDDVKRHGNLVWVRVIDEYGDETCLAAPHHIVFSAPISMIQKRLRRKEKVDLMQLREATLETSAKQIPSSMDR